MRSGISYRTTVALVLSTPFVAWGWIGLVEWMTLSDNVASNHVTASFRRMLDETPELFVVILLGVVLVNSLALGVVVGHIWNRWGPSKPRKKDW